MARTVAAQQLQLEPALLEPPRTTEDSHSSRATRPSPEPKQKPAVQGPSAEQLLETPGALLTRSHLRGLGLGRRAIDAVFRALPVVALPGYSRPLIRAEQYLELVEEHTYRDDRVRSCRA